MKVELLPKTTTKTPSIMSVSLQSLFKNALSFLIGLTFGIYFTVIWLNYATQCLDMIVKTQATSTTTRASEQLPATASEAASTSAAAIDMDNDGRAPVDIVEYLHNTTRVLCWIMTNPDNHLTKAIHIRNTWGRRCNKLLFMSSQEDEELQTIALPVEEGRNHLWTKTRKALKYIYDHHLDDAEWFLKADDDTYIIMENLRSFLYPFPSDAPLYFGCKLDTFVRQGYMSGGAGFVLSKTALVKFSTEAYDDLTLCPNRYAVEDVQLGMCLENIGVIAGDSRDVDGKERFVPLPPDYVLYENCMVEWYFTNVHRAMEQNVTCCSPHAISFHYITKDGFYVLDYLLYSLRPFGVFAHLNDSLPRKLDLSDILSNALEYVPPLVIPTTPAANSESK